MAGGLKRRTRAALLAIAALMVAADLLLFFRDEAFVFYLNAKAGCWPWSPKVVDYHEGMTICPGQSARATIIIQIKRRRDDEI